MQAVRYCIPRVTQDTMTLRHPSDVINGDNQSLAAEKRAPADVTAADSMCSYADWTAIAPTRQVHVVFDHNVSTKQRCQPYPVQ